MAHPIDYGSIVSPVSRSMSMVADHMLRAPAIQYRLQLERQRLAQQDALNQVRAEDYRASARKTNAEAEGIEGQNEAKRWLQENDQTFSALVDAGTVTTEQMNQYARAYARATGRDMKDTMDGLIALAAARKGAAGAKPADVAAMTPGSAASLAGAGLRADATRDAATIRAESAAKNPPADEYETVTEKYPEVPAEPGQPAIPAQYGWFGRKKSDEIPATPGKPGQPERTVSYKRKRGGVADLAGSGVEDFADQTMDDDSEPDVTDPSEASEGEGVSGIQNGNEAAQASAPQFKGQKVQNQADIDMAMADANEAIAGTGPYADPKTGKPMPRNRKLVLERLKQMGITLKE